MRIPEMRRNDRANRNWAECLPPPARQTLKQILEKPAEIAGQPAEHAGNPAPSCCGNRYQGPDHRGPGSADRPPQPTNPIRFPWRTRKTGSAMPRPTWAATTILGCFLKLRAGRH